MHFLDKITGISKQVMPCMLYIYSISSAISPRSLDDFFIYTHLFVVYFLRLFDKIS